MTLATQLSIYNGACTAIGERILQPASPGGTYSTENRESRRALDDVWNRGGVRTCLSMGLWNFAGRGIQWNYDPDYTPPFGYQCAFQLPTDWVRWMMVCTDPYMSNPLIQYTDEGQYFFCDLQILYVKYCSSDPKFGMNMAFWPDNFQRYVEYYFAQAICLRVTGDQKKLEDVAKLADQALKKAKSTDAMNESTAMLPAGQWRQARHGRRANVDRGNPYDLYG
ncbi:MAG TPA: hypothetical protein VGG49_13365 [Steroidobacteraceae bacterium]|jgi:hypothetical protein